MSSKSASPKFDCPHCGNNKWIKNTTSCGIDAIEPKSFTTGKKSGQYVEVMFFACSNCGYIVFFRIP